jgi:hypothetical protein
MDHFGIGQAMQAAARIYFQSARRTGRTTSLLDSLKDGDRICCATSKEAARLERMCHERKLKVECIVIDPASPERLMERPTSEGRTIFDHSWVEQFYADTLERARNAIDNFQRETSGFGEAHRETRRKAEEMQRWNC